MRLPADLANVVLERAEGNPFFLEELARAIGDDDDAQVGSIVPETVHGVLMARIDRLPEAPRRVLQYASVLGREFSVRLLLPSGMGRVQLARTWRCFGDKSSCMNNPQPVSTATCSSMR